MGFEIMRYGIWNMRYGIMRWNGKAFVTHTKNELKIHHHKLLVRKRAIAVFLCFLFFLNTLAWGQDKDITYHQAPNTTQNAAKKNKNEDYLKRISVGGTGAFSIGGYTTYIEISPNVAYHFNKIVCVGVGGSYTFFNDNYSNYTNHIFGTKLFAEAHFLNFLGAQAAYRALNYRNPIPSIEKDRIWSNNLCLGGGYYQRAGRVSVYFFVLYNWSDRPPKENIFSPVLFEGGFSVFLK